MVSYRDSAGQQSYHETDELGAAIAYVEHLRNDEGVDHARIYTLAEVSFEFRPYFRVEIADNASLPAPPVVEAADDPAADVDHDPLATAWAASERVDESGESVGAGMGRRGLFGR